uniref:Uncharacterized protein n=1 Tax=Cacopsylla melanoneura TaxID=428564 RepID=A0A8D9AVL8_9HEMI
MLVIVSATVPIVEAKRFSTKVPSSKKSEVGTFTFSLQNTMRVEGDSGSDPPSKIPLQGNVPFLSIPPLPPSYPFLFIFLLCLQFIFFSAPQHSSRETNSVENIQVV